MKQVQVVITAATDVPKDPILDKLSIMYDLSPQRTTPSDRNGPLSQNSFKGVISKKKVQPGHINFGKITEWLNATPGITKKFSKWTLSSMGLLVTEGSVGDKYYQLYMGANYVVVRMKQLTQAAA